MADASLDDIIKQKRMKRFNLNKKAPVNRMNQNQKKGGLNKGGRLFKDVQKDLGIKTNKNLSINTDARNRIIQKQRTKFRDARDRLAQIAKQGDARDKLNQIRKGKPGDKVIPQQKKTVVKKKIVNIPRQTLNVGQTRMKGAAVIRTVAGANKKIIRGKPGVVRRAAVVTKGNRPGGRMQTMSNNAGVFTIKNNNMRPYDTYEVVNYRPEVQLAPRGQSFATGMGVPTGMDTMLVGPETIIRARPAEQVVYAREYEPEVRPSRLRITTANSNYRVGGQQQYADQWQESSWEGRKRDYYDAVDYQQVYPKKMATVQAPVVQADPGTKVVVSNLHPCVSVEDMEELLGTVGSVFSVRMVRQGVAEAFFVSQDDAYRSVELFNNRQLEGQPMKVMVVRKKTQVVSSAPARSVLRNARILLIKHLLSLNRLTLHSIYIWFIKCRVSSKCILVTLIKGAVPVTMYSEVISYSNRENVETDPKTWDVELERRSVNLLPPAPISIKP
ncbi:LOW QUALITY PROTEIN: polymerase delta-interacting protein 3-like [Palaemon carinicauda]|uniref:LOW QUALITY PROTEIN: polymerase delta-interacting protein 3-like n=1 Tax=Palaemon carinicauda TaxID=392227 RepID=UPI0035B5EAF9